MLRSNSCQKDVSHNSCLFRLFYPIGYRSALRKSCALSSYKLLFPLVRAGYSTQLSYKPYFVLLRLKKKFRNVVLRMMKIKKPVAVDATTERLSPRPAGRLSLQLLSVQNLNEEQRRRTNRSHLEG